MSAANRNRGTSADGRGPRKRTRSDNARPRPWLDLETSRPAANDEHSRVERGEIGKILDEPARKLLGREAAQDGDGDRTVTRPPCFGKAIQIDAVGNPHHRFDRQVALERRLVFGQVDVRVVPRRHRRAVVPDGHPPLVADPDRILGIFSQECWMTTAGRSRAMRVRCPISYRAARSECPLSEFRVIALAPLLAGIERQQHLVALSRQGERDVGRDAAGASTQHADDVHYTA